MNQTLPQEVDLCHSCNLTPTPLKPRSGEPPVKCGVGAGTLPLSNWCTWQLNPVSIGQCVVAESWPSWTSIRRRPLTLLAETG